MATKAQIGEALDSLSYDVEQHTLHLVKDYRSTEDRLKEGSIKQAVDTPARARAQIQEWITQYNARKGAGAAQIFLAECLAAAGSSKTLAQIDAALQTQQNQAQVLVNHRLNDGWTWDQVATAIENQISPPEPEEDFTFRSLPIPSNYVTVWGDPW